MTAARTKERAPVPERISRVLVVEDDVPHLEAMTRRMQELGLEVLPCSDSRDALKALLDQRFDLLVTDLQMAPMDGLELLRVVRMLEYRLPEIGRASCRERV